MTNSIWICCIFHLRISKSKETTLFLEVEEVTELCCVMTLFAAIVQRQSMLTSMFDSTGILFWITLIDSHTSSDHYQHYHCHRHCYQHHQHHDISCVSNVNSKCIFKQSPHIVTRYRQAADNVTVSKTPTTSSSSSGATSKKTRADSGGKSTRGSAKSRKSNDFFIGNSPS